MGIKGLTDRQAAFPKLGVLRKGAPKPEQGNKLTDLDCFRFDSQDKKALQVFAQAYGETPREINVYLPYQTVEQNFLTSKEEWSAGGLKHRCDGEICEIWQTPDGKYSREPRPCPGNCKEVGRLSVIIPELRRFAFVVAETHSIHDIITLQENLIAAEMLRGDLRGIPFKLCRRPRMVSTPGTANNPKRSRREKWLLSIEPTPEYTTRKLLAMQQEAMPMLPGSMVELEAESEEIDVEIESVVEVVEAAEDRRPRFRQIMQWTGQAPAFVKTICRGLFDGKDSADQLTPDQCDRLRDELFALWGDGQQKFTTIYEARNSYKNALKEMEYPTDEEIWMAWSAKVEAKPAIAAEPPLQGREAPTTANGKSID